MPTMTLEQPYTRTSAGTAAPPPERSHQQRMTALEHANEIRSWRAQLKRDLKAGRVSILAVLRDPPDELATAKVWDVLLAVPKIGRTKVHKALKSCGISLGKTVAGLSERQRCELVTLLGSYPVR